MPSYSMLCYGKVQGTLVSFEVKSADRKVPERWGISVIAHMPSKGITMVIQLGVVLATKLAAGCDNMLINIDKTYNPDLEKGIIDAQEAMGRCALCDHWGHIGKDYTKTRPPGVRCSGTPQPGEKMYRSKVKLRHVVVTGTAVCSHF